MWVAQHSLRVVCKVPATSNLAFLANFRSMSLKRTHFYSLNHLLNITNCIQNK